jgi:arylsulfatase A-like enzyme
MPNTNVIFILTDDQGVWSAGCYGNPEIRTPNLDRLASDGIRFENFFVATPVCSPSRATFLTGRIPSQHGVHDFIKGGDVGPDAIRYLQGETAYTDILARHGWTCGLSGKWHLGDGQIPQHGFTDWFVHQGGGGPYYDAPMVRNGQLVTEPGYVTDVITDEALRILDKYADGDGSFYLGVHYTAPHSPWIGQHPKELTDSYDDCAFESCPQEPRHPWALPCELAPENYEALGNREALKGYFASVTAMDIGVGRILDRLEELGLRENTLIVFLSDNGCSCGHHGFWGKGNATNPRNMYENSIRVPAIFSQPGRIPSDRVDDAMVSAYDFMPTLLEYLDLPAGDNRSLPGRSFLPLLEGRPFRGRENVVVYDEYGPVRMIRTRDWKYVYRHAHGPHDLFDLANDPDERTNLADDPDQRDRINELHQRMNDWFAQYVVATRDGLRQDVLTYGQTQKVD